jgi:hypothetical protein
MARTNERDWRHGHERKLLSHYKWKVSHSLVLPLLRRLKVMTVLSSPFKRRNLLSVTFGIVIADAWWGGLGLWISFSDQYKRNGQSFLSLSRERLFLSPTISILAAAAAAHEKRERRLEICCVNPTFTAKGRSSRLRGLFSFDKYHTQHVDDRSVWVVRAIDNGQVTRKKKH